jgi:hypothetical protein
MTTALIQFRCKAIDHQNVAVLNVTVSPITLHEHRWAYCPLGVSEGHEWAKLEIGRSFDEVRRTTFSEARVGRL